jgi:hypothetical protein
MQQEMPISELIAKPQGERRPLADFVKAAGGRFSVELGIDLPSGKPSEIFKWFLAAILFGARISGSIAAQTYREFAKERLLSPEKIARREWDGLVEVLDRGGYVRYDFKTATKLLEVCRALSKQYRGDLNTLHAQAKNPRNLEQRIRELGKGIGDVTIGIFLRELRGTWPMAEPLPSELVLVGAQDLGLLPRSLKDKRCALVELKAKWEREGSQLSQFPDFEAALVRRGLSVRRRFRKQTVKV